MRPALGDLRVSSPGTTDLTLVCRDGQLQAHQAMLSLHSLLVRGLCEERGRLREVQLLLPRVQGIQPSIREVREAAPLVTLLLPHYTLRTVRALLDLIYTGKCSDCGDLETQGELALLALYRDLGLDAELGGLPGIADLDQVEGGQHGPVQQQSGRQVQVRKSQQAQEQVKKNTGRQVQVREPGASEIQLKEVGKIASLGPGLEMDGAIDEPEKEHVKQVKVVKLVPEAVLKQTPANVVKQILEIVMKRKEGCRIVNKQATAEQDLVTHKKKGRENNVNGSKDNSFSKVTKVIQCSELHKSKCTKNTKKNIKSISRESNSSKHLQIMQTKNVQEKERKEVTEILKHPVQEIVEELLASVTQTAKKEELSFPKHHRTHNTNQHSMPPIKLSHLKKIKLEKAKSRKHKGDGQPSIQMYKREWMVPETPRGTRKKVALFRGLKRQIQMPARFRDKEPTNPKTNGTSTQRDMRCRVRLALEGRETMKDIPSSFQRSIERQHNLSYLRGGLGSCNVIQDQRNKTQEAYQNPAEEMEISQQILEVAVQAPTSEAVKVFRMP